MTKRMPDEEPLIVAQPMARNRSRDLRDLLSCLFLCKVGDLLRSHLAVEKSRKHQPAGHAENVRQHVTELDVRIFKHLLNVGKKFVVVCVMTGGAKDEPHTQIKKFGTIVSELQRLADGWSPKGVPMP